MCRHEWISLKTDDAPGHWGQGAQWAIGVWGGACGALVSPSRFFWVALGEALGSSDPPHHPPPCAQSQ